MANAISRTIHAEHHHYVWDRGLLPVVSIAPGDVVEVEVNDPSGGQVTARTTPEEIARLDFSRINPATGPIRVDGAVPGHVLRVSVLDLALGGWAWTANVPGFGLLSDSFAEPAVHFWSYRPGDVAVEGLGARVRAHPSTGCMGWRPPKRGPTISSRPAAWEGP